MDTLSAFAMGDAHRNDPLMVFDWDKAAQIIKERGAQNASAGLAGDWGMTGGEILTDGEPNMEDYTYLASTWATPQLKVDGVLMDCWKYAKDTDGWDAKTKWPKSSLKILNNKTAHKRKYDK